MSQPVPPPPVPAAVTPPLANWVQRVLGYLVDALVTAVPAGIAAAVIAAGSSTTTVITADGAVRTTDASVSAGALVVALLLYGVSLALFIWNICIRQGRTGQSVGKTVMGLKLVSGTTGQPIGAGMAFVRYLLHFIDSLACYLGWLWPIWDPKRQTFADKIVNTFVVKL